jgi:23S rRNA (guanine745-N1)-methyltransferase
VRRLAGDRRTVGDEETPVRSDVVAALRCPLEGGALQLDDRSLACAEGHRFDLARQGYVNLVVGREPGTGDDAAMVAARAEVLAAGRFAALSTALAELVADEAPTEGVVVDLGAGTGHHLAAVVEARPGPPGIALDLSKHAARRAARCHPRVGAVVADVWGGLPLRDGVAGAALCVFAPRNAEELTRVLRPDGVLVVATPTAHHLGELVGPLGLLEVEPHKPDRLLRSLRPALRQVGPVRRVEVRWQLERPEVRAVVAMGPSADHLTPDVLDERIGRLPASLGVTAAVELRTFHRG